MEKGGKWGRIDFQVFDLSFRARFIPKGDASAKR
jgi:hypothetical protein